MAIDYKAERDLANAENSTSSASNIDSRSFLAVEPSINGAAVIHAYQDNIMGADTDMAIFIDRLQETCAQVKSGDLQKMEAMLISQANALQSIFTSLARKAQKQIGQKSFEGVLGLALKAQAQSRATISTLVELKYPRQATFVKQANIAQGPQQVNNCAQPDNLGDQPASVCSRGKKSKVEQNKLLEADHGQPGSWMDTRTAQKTERSDQAMETVDAVHRAKKPRG